MRCEYFFHEEYTMIRLDIGPHVGASDAAPVRSDTARLCIYALGLALFLSSPVLAAAQTAASGREVQPAPSRDAIPTQLTRVDAPAATPTSREVPGGDHIRPFRARVSDADVADLRRRLAATRWPDKETATDQSQGAQLASLKELVRYWATD